MIAGTAVGASTPDTGTPAPAGSAGNGAGRHTGKKPRRLARPPARLSLSNWPVSARLVAVFVVASVTGLVFGTLRVTDAISTSNSYGRTAQVAILGAQATNLAKDLENERDIYAGVAAYGVLATNATADKAAPSVALAIGTDLAKENAKLASAERITSAQSQQVRALAAAIGPAFPSGVQGNAGSVVTMLDSIPGLRSQLVGQPAVEIIANYSNSIADLFNLTDDITLGSGDASLADEVRALGGLSRAQDQASQQRAFVYATLIETSVNDAGGGNTAPFNTVGLQSLSDAGGLSLLTTSQGVEFADLQTFNDAATAAQANAYLASVGGPQADDAQLIEGFIGLNGDPRQIFEVVDNKTSLGYPKATVAQTWYSDESAVLDQMRAIEAQVVNAIVSRSQTLQQNALNSAILTAVVTGTAVLLVLLATALVGRTLVRPLRRLQADALEIASVRLPARVEAAAAGTDATEGPPAIEPIGVQSTDEIGRVARAFDEVHATAVRLAGNEAQLRSSLNAMFISLSRRSVPLIDRLARMIDAMEQNEDEPDQLAKLFSMDHLVTRMRRNSENLLVLAGEEPVRKWTDSVPLTDVARAAASEIEQYSRVALAIQPGIMISGQAAADVVHLLAELIENATMFSPQTTSVRVTVMELTSGGVLVEVRDDGVGVSPNRLSDMNWRLDNPPMVDVSISRHMGLYAVSRLAARHGIRVKLRPAAPQGLSALVWLPSTIAKRESVPATSTHTRPIGIEATGPVAGIPATTPARPVTGRHRSALATSGDQPLVTGREGLARREGRAGREKQAGRSTAAWFTAKRPSSGDVKSVEELEVDWRSTASAGPTDAGPSVPQHAGQTSSGLPRRVPRTSAYPGTDTLGAGMAATVQPTAVQPAAPAAAADAGVPALGAPLDGMASQGVPYQEAPRQELPSRRRSPEAARSRLSGFQLGQRDAVEAGHTGGWTPQPGEENSR
jgi:signal transduction histidine kinase